MIESARPKSESCLETAIPNDAAPLESIVCTQQLLKRPSRPPDHEKENSVLVALVSALADSPNTILQTLADKMLEVLPADSAGLSLLTKDGKEFYWAAIAGAWRPHAGGASPRNFSPSGDVLDRNSPMLFSRWERRYRYLRSAMPLAEEALLAPFHVNGGAVGTIWAIAHTGRRKFDAEDVRLLQSIGRFASAAYQSRAIIGTLVQEIGARQEAERKLRKLTDGLEGQVRVRTEELRMSESRWKRIFDNSAIGIAVTDLEGRFELANAAYQKMLGFTEQELAAETYLDLTVEAFHPYNIALVTKLLNGTRDQFDIEKQHRRKDGQLIWVRNNVSLLPGADGAPRNIMAIVEDISERKAAEESLQQTQTRLSQAAEVATAAELYASIAHELNQPLAGIVANASTCLRMLDSQAPNVEGARQTAQRTLRDCNRASEVITRLRALFSKRRSATDRVDLNEAAQEVLALSLARFKNNRTVLRIELADGLPPVTGNRVQLQQVILNLLQNALDAMNGVDECRRLVVIRTAFDQNGVRLSVQDAGVGFAPEAANRLFETFYTTKSEGMGVGLSVSRSIIEDHGGRLWAAANEGPGATFSFSIPRQTEDASALNTATPLEQPPLTTP